MLYRVDQDTCQLTQIGTGTGFVPVSGLAFAADGTLFGSTGEGSFAASRSQVPELIRIDTNTGVGAFVAPITGDVKVTFTTGPKAAETLSDESPIRAAGAAEDGFAKYELIFDKPES